MKFRVLLDLENWASLTTKVGTNNTYNISSIEFVGQTPTINFTRLIIEWNSNNSYYEFRVYNQNTLIGTYHGNEVLQNIGDSLLIDCNVSFTFYEDAIKLENNLCVDMGEEFDGVTNILTYKLNDQNDALNKKLTVIGSITGNFKAPLSIKNIEIDVLNFNPITSFNYVYIPRLKRFYYVTNIQMINKEYTRLILQEDVLMSWQDLIKSQSAFITRYEGSTLKKIVDSRRPLQDVLSVQYITPTMTPSESGGQVNISFNGYLADNKFKILVSTISTDIGNKKPVYSPTILGAPDLMPIQSKNERIAFISYDQLQYLIGACLDDDNIMTFINSAIFLPFDPENAYTGAVTSDGWIAGVVMANNKYLCDDYKFRDTTPEGVSQILCKRTLAGATPYFVVADFTFNGVTNDFLDYDPYTSWEIYVPFCGWIKVNASQVLGNRIFVYYTLDTKTGMGTAYIFDRTHNQLIWSSNCQLGIKLDLTTTNTTEITRQKEANELNMILGLMASALSIGVGVVTENPVAVAGGILSAGKTIASNVNSNKMLFERAQTSFGTSEGQFHSPFDVVIRRNYHDKINIDETVYKGLEGLPYNKYDSLSSLTGYVEIADIHFDAKGYNIYNDEITEIVSLLKNGVIM